MSIYQAPSGATESGPAAAAASAKFPARTRVLIVDDLLATGGTAKATLDLVKGSEGVVVGLAFLIELIGLDGRSRLTGENVHAVLKY